MYRAKDLRLGREIALKVLPAEMGADPDRLTRLEREARTVAGRNPPKIVMLHPIGHDGVGDFVPVAGKEIGLGVVNPRSRIAPRMLGMIL